MKYKILLSTIVTVILLSIVATVNKSSNKVQLQQIDIKTKAQEIEIKTKKSEELQKQLEDAHGDLEKLKTIEQENKKLQEDIKALQAKKAEKARIAEAEKKTLAERAVNAVTGTQKAYAASGNFYKDFIYQHESGNRTTAVNSIGCRGLGQACPGTKLPCGDDYACQDAWFTNYAMTRYGSWEAAYNWWTVHRWW